MANHAYILFELKKKSLLSLLSIKNLPRSEKGGSDQQVTPEFLKEAFSAKATQKPSRYTV
jgi:hypothetical protein